MDECRLTVLMAVRNGGPYLRTAIDSILQQTYRDFRFLIVDDASTDDTREIVRSYWDKRVELICLDRNVGQTAALNIGLRQASTPWIARMDADDYSAPTRLEEQMEALDADSSLSCVGTFAWTFREDHRVMEGVISTPVHHAEIQRMLSGSPIIHGSLVASRAALLDVGAYNDHYRYTADVELYDRLLPRYRAANIPRLLLGVRRHSNQGSRSSVALDENIEISSRRLGSSSYSPRDAATIRANLSRSYVVRARHWGSQGNLRELGKDMFRALRAAPGPFPLYSFKYFIVYSITERDRARLKRLIVRVVSGVKGLRESQRGGA